MPRILNKLNGEILNIDYIPTPSKLISYFDDQWVNYVEIPDDGKEYEPIEVDPFYQEKPINFEQLKKYGLAYYAKKILAFRSIPINYPEGNTGFLINLPDLTTLNVYADLNEKFISYLVTILSTSGVEKKAKVTRIDNGLSEIVTLSGTEITRIHDIITEKFYALQDLDTRIENKIKTASDELTLAIWSMNDDQLEIFAMSIIGDAENILLMTDNEFDTYIDTLVAQISST